MNSLYSIFLEGNLIGATLLEKADAPMGVVFGQIIFDIDFSYSFLREYCILHNIEFTEYPEDKLISTFDIPDLKVVSPEGIVIKGLSTYIYGMDDDGFEISVIGVPYPFYEKEFPHHVVRYK